MLLFIHPAQFANQKMEHHWDIPVWWTLGLWLLAQSALLAMGDTNIAVSAHLGGFAAGAGLAALLRSQHCKGTSWYLEPAPAGGGPAATRRLRKARARAPRAAPMGRGSPEAAEASRAVVVLTGLLPKASPVAAIKLLMRHRGLTPEDAKLDVDAIKGGEAQRYGFDDAADAATFQDDALAIGVISPEEA